MSQSERSILLVDDDPRDRELSIRALRKHQVANEIVAMPDGIEALEYLFGRGRHAARAGADLPAVVLLDLKLPKVDGFDVLRALRSDLRTRTLPVVLLTSSNEERDRAAGYDLGANSYVRKPIEFAAFQQAVSELGVYWLIRNEPPPRRAP